jgi:hypothetical protein
MPWPSGAGSLTGIVSHMGTPQQCLQLFLKERSAAYALANARLEPVYAKYFGEPLLGHTGDLLLRDKVEHVFEEVNQSEKSAVIVTREHFVRATAQRIHKRVGLLTSGEPYFAGLPSVSTM